MAATAIALVAGVIASAVDPVMAVPDLANGNSVPNKRGRTIIIVENTNAATRTVTVAIQQPNRPGDNSYGPATVANLDVVVPALTGRRVIGPFPAAYNDVNGNIQLTYSAVTGVTLGTYELP